MAAHAPARGWPTAKPMTNGTAIEQAASIPIKGRICDRSTLSANCTTSLADPSLTMRETYRGSLIAVVTMERNGRGVLGMSHISSPTSYPCPRDCAVPIRHGTVRTL
jgi:hypothetical protein